jgi:hypothetical protein
MGRISKMSGVEAQLVNKLSARNVASVEELWLSIGPKFEKGIASFSGQDFKREQVVGILILGACAPVPKSTGKWHRFSFWLMNHGLELVALIIILILFSLLLLKVSRKQDTVVVTTSSELPVFHVVLPGEAGPKKLFKVPGSFANKGDVEGRYLLQGVSPGTILLENQLGPSELRGQLDGRSVLTIPIRAGAISSMIAPASHVCLLFSPHSRDPKSAATPLPTPSIHDLSIDAAIVLTINRQGDASSITVAVRNNEDLIKTINLSSTSDVLISQPTCGSTLSGTSHK